MEPRKLTPLILPFLFVAFGISCLLVWFYRGKSKRWINNKLKLGGVILSLTTITTGCPIVTCYDPPMMNQFVFDKQESGYDLNLQFPSDTLVSGKIYGRQADKYTFELLKNDTILLQKGNIKAIDGVFDQDPEPFNFILNSELDPGDYFLKLLSVKMVNNTEQEFEVDFRRIKIEK
jgi:hypothetical protein